VKFRLPHIAFEATSGCNLDCVFCYNIWKIPGARIKSARGSYRRSRETLKELFRQADVPHVTLTGGEPMLSQRLVETALFCRMEDKGVTVITNGTQGSPRQYRDLVRIGVSLFELPVHSFDPRVHDRMAGVEGSWERSTGAIRYLRELGADPVVVVVLTRHNAAGVAATLEYIVEGLGVRRVMVNRYNIGGRGAADPLSVSASGEELRRALGEIDAVTAGKGLRVTSNVCSPHCVIDPGDYPHVGFGNCSPDPLHRPVTLDAEGNVRLCNHSPVVAGNIFSTPIESILNSPYARSWEITVPSLCHSCVKWERCLGGCRAASEQTGRGLSSADPLIGL
jgi:radical SAM protein with 4Fe4S-binding SPASM domain